MQGSAGHRSAPGNIFEFSRGRRGNKVKSEPRSSVVLPERTANTLPSGEVARSETLLFAADTVNALGVAAFHRATGPPAELPNERYTVSPFASACISGAPITEVTSGSYVGVVAVMFNCPRQPLHAPEEPPSPLSPTNTVEAFVAVTRAGPELTNPATPPTATLVSGVAGWFGSAR